MPEPTSVKPASTCSASCTVTTPGAATPASDNAVPSPTRPHLTQPPKCLAGGCLRARSRDLRGQRRDLLPPALRPHDFRRIFATEAVSGGLPVHIVARLLGHTNINTTQAYIAVFDEELVRSYRAFLDKRRSLRPEAEYRQPTDQEWGDFQQHFQVRKLELGECGRPYGSPCKHEHVPMPQLATR